MAVKLLSLKTVLDHNFGIIRETIKQGMISQIVLWILAGLYILSLSLSLETEDNVVEIIAARSKEITRSVSFEQCV